MTGIEDNPYKPPASTLDVRTPTERPPNRYVRAGLFAFETWGGLAVCFFIVWEICKKYTLVADDSFHFVVFCWTAVLATPFGVAMAWWVWRQPQSKWACCVANTLGLAPFALTLIGILFLGLE